MANDPNQFGLWRPWHPAEVARLFFLRLQLPGGSQVDGRLISSLENKHAIMRTMMCRSCAVINRTFARFFVGGMSRKRTPAGPSCCVAVSVKWEVGEALSPQVHDVWCRPNKIAPGFSSL